MSISNVLPKYYIAKSAILEGNKKRSDEMQVVKRRKYILALKVKLKVFTATCVFMYAVFNSAVNISKP